MQNLSDFDKRVAGRFRYRCIIDFKRFHANHHIVPRSLGGEDNDENKVPLCLECHRRIHNTGAVNWVKYLTELRKKRLEEFATNKRLD